MFHSARDKIRNSNQICERQITPVIMERKLSQRFSNGFDTLFWQHIFNAEILFIVVGDFNTDFQRILSTVELIGACDGTNGDVAFGISESFFEIANDETGQVGDHFYTRVKPDCCQTVGWTVVGKILHKYS